MLMNLDFMSSSGHSKTSFTLLLLVIGGLEDTQEYAGSTSGQRVEVRWMGRIDTKGGRRRYTQV